MGYKVVGLLLVATFLAVSSRVIESEDELNAEGIFKPLEAIEELKSRARRSPDDHDHEELLENIKSSLSDTAQSVRKGISTVIQDVRKSETYENVKSGLNNLGDRISDQFKKVGSQIQQKIEDKFD